MVVGTIGNLQALLTIQYLIGLSEFTSNQLIKFDGLNLDWKKWKLLADPDCPVCAAGEINASKNQEVPSLC